MGYTVIQEPAFSAVLNMHHMFGESVALGYARRVWTQLSGSQQTVFVNQRPILELYKFLKLSYQLLYLTPFSPQHVSFFLKYKNTLDYWCNRDQFTPKTS